MTKRSFSPKRRLVDMLMKDQLAPYVRRRRAQGVGWVHISREIQEQTGEYVAYETLRAWFPDDDEAPVAG